MSDARQVPDEMADLELRTRAERLEEDRILYETDTPPAEYRNFHGELDAAIDRVGHIYPAIVTAHFPNRETADRALQGLQQLNLRRQQAIQVFEKEEPETKWDRNDEGLKPGEVAIVVQLDEEAQGEEGTRICEEAGALHTRYYPKQQLGNVPPEER